MYDINTKAVSNSKKKYFIILIVGFVLLCICVLTIVIDKMAYIKLDTNVVSNMVEVKTSKDKKYQGVYYYMVDGKQYSCESKYTFVNPSSDNKLVYYSSKDPSKCLVDGSSENKTLTVLGILIPSIVIFFGIFEILMIDKRVKNLEVLKSHGKLIKGINYNMKNIKIGKFNIISIPIVKYSLNNNVIELKGKAKFFKKVVEESGNVDLLIDEKNPRNYYIDSNINRSGGSYYQE